MTATVVWTRRCPLCRAPLSKRDPTAPWVCGCGWRGVDLGIPIHSENCSDQEKA